MSPQADLRSSTLDIAEVAARSGLSVSALRYYEERGLIASSGRKGLRRQFAADVLERLALVAVGRDAGFTLDEIAGMFGPDGEPAIDRALLSTRADDLDRTIRRLTVLRDGLRHAAACPAPRHLDCPTFRRIMTRAMRPRPASR
ncbi:helix-turn-helix domain-containing protein [Catenuloplanes niger JCM 9533]